MNRLSIFILILALFLSSGSHSLPAGSHCHLFLSARSFVQSPSTLRLNRHQDFRKISAALGKFYSAVMDVILDIGSPEVKRQKINQLVEEMPVTEQIKKNYRKGVARVLEVLQENHAILTKHRGNEVAFLLRSTMKNNEITPKKIKEVLKKARRTTIFQRLKGERGADFFELYPGIGFIRVMTDFFELLKSVGIVPENAGGVHIPSIPGKTPNFIAIPWSSNPRIERHELQHFFWECLKWGRFLKGTTLRFDHFLDELCSYILDGSNIGEVRVTAFSSAKENRWTEATRDRTSLWIDLAKASEIPQENFLYAAMTSTDPFDFFDKCEVIAQVENLSEKKLIETLVRSWDKGKKIKKNWIYVLLRNFSKERGKNLFPEFARSLALTENKNIFLEIAHDLNLLKELAIEDGVNVSFIDQAVIDALKKRLPLPTETIQEMLDHVSLNSVGLCRLNLKDAREFLRYLIRFHHLDSKDKMPVYQRIIHSSPLLAVAYAEIVEEIIEKETNDLRQGLQHVMQNPQKRNEIEMHIQQRAERLRRLTETPIELKRAIPLLQTMEADL